MPFKKLWPWIGAASVTIVLTALFAFRLWGDDRTMFLPGATTSGHHQIEADCDACHTAFFGVKQEACTTCHGAELEAVDDSHPRGKFEDPRNADRLAMLDARYCVTCHVEHRPDRTRAMGVTLADDYCFLCHEDIGTERKTHVGLGFDTCATSGCHNYHDNTALYEDFLLAHRDEPALKPGAVAPSRMLASILRTAGRMKPPLSATAADGPAPVRDDIRDEWFSSSHAHGGVNCRDCHVAAGAWTDHPDTAACGECHAREHDGFLAGKHGMRIARKLSPMRVAQARQPMRAKAAHETLGCTSCHASHGFDTQHAAADACLACHDDDHTRSWAASPHAALWQAEVQGRAPAGGGVSCATCHLPRVASRESGETVIHVEHNQNANLRPSDKMLRTSCMQCHGLAFSIDALADKALVACNLRGRPSVHVESIEMAVRNLHDSSQSRGKSP